MDAVTFVKEKQRMCNSFGDICEKQCPLRKLCGGCIIDDPDAEPEDVVSAVEKWSKEHPLVTNGDMVWKLIPSDVRSTEKRGARDDFPYSENAPCAKDHYVITVTADWWDAECKGEETIPKWKCDNCVYRPPNKEE